MTLCLRLFPWFTSWLPLGEIIFLLDKSSVCISNHISPGCSFVLGHKSLELAAPELISQDQSTLNRFFHLLFFVSIFGYYPDTPWTLAMIYDSVPCLINIVCCVLFFFHLFSSRQVPGFELAYLVIFLSIFTVLGLL